MRKTARWVGGVFLALLWASEGAGDALTVRETSESIVIRSDRAPTWKMEIAKARGLVRSLIVPADGGDEVIAGHQWANAFGRSMGYHDFGQSESWQMTNRNIAEQISTCKVVESSPR